MGCCGVYVAIYGVDAGTYEARLTAEGYYPKSASITVPDENWNGQDSLNIEVGHYDTEISNEVVFCTDTGRLSGPFAVKHPYPVESRYVSQ